MTPPPIPEQAKKHEAPKVVQDESAMSVIPDLTHEVTEEDVQEIPDMTHEAKMEPSAETAAAMKEVMAIQKSREDETMLAEALKAAEAAYAPATAAEKTAFDASIKASMEKMAKSEPKAQEVSMMESVRDLMAKDVETMEASIKTKFSVDVAVQSSKGLLGRIGAGFRSMMNGDLRRAMGEYRSKLEQMNKLSENIDDAKMTKEDWSKRSGRAFLRGIDRGMKSDSINVRDK